MVTEKFQGMAKEYAKYRPSYPEELYEFLFKEFNFSEQKTIADIGAGTGKFSLPLLKENLKVYCVEPNKDMKAEMDKMLGSYENYTGVCASAENTTLTNQSVDHIVCAQAFHWFDRSLFKEECKRIIKPGKHEILLIWNIRCEDDRMNKCHYDINKQYCPAFKGFSGGISKIDPGQFRNFFLNGKCNYQVFVNNLSYVGLDAFVGKCLTGSYAPKSTQSHYKNYVNALKNLYEQYASDQSLVVKNNTIVYWGNV